MNFLLTILILLSSVYVYNVLSNTPDNNCNNNDNNNTVCASPESKPNLEIMYRDGVKAYYEGTSDISGIASQVTSDYEICWGNDGIGCYDVYNNALYGICDNGAQIISENWYETELIFFGQFRIWCQSSKHPNGGFWASEMEAEELTDSLFNGGLFKRSTVIFLPESDIQFIKNLIVNYTPFPQPPTEK